MREIVPVFMSYRWRGRVSDNADPKLWRHDPVACDQAYADLVRDYRSIKAERDRLLKVVDAAREFKVAEAAASAVEDTDVAWHKRLFTFDKLKAEIDRSNRRTAAIVALFDAVAGLDAEVKTSDD